MAIGFNSIRASDSWCRRRKRNYAMSIKRLLDAIECRGDVGRRIAALVLPISNRPRVTSSCARKIGLREPGEHTSGPNLSSRDNVAHNPTLYTNPLAMSALLPIADITADLFESPLCAKSGHSHCSKPDRYSITSSVRASSEMVGRGPVP